ncbi:MAG: hypothetical protein HKN44_06205 [Ilumatobacter sp.]|nr:hypothetical protein [Ilumatobacter sp.]
MTTTPTPQESPSSKRSKGLAFGLSAGLVGGTVAGMVFGIPGLSSAATDTEPAALVQQVDDTATTTTDEAPEPGEKLRELLQELVDGDTITADQADAVTAHLVENRPDRSDRPGHRGPGGRFGRAAVSEAVTDLLGIDGDDLRQQLRDGSTLADIAAANGVEVQALIDTLVDEAEARVATALESGKIDQTKADDITSQIEDKVTDLVNGERPQRGDVPVDDPEG